eukprot:CCRYP_015562-RA/>CCRYP_015562-RA protein AED:0.34 eAED:0.35 QI:0/0/0/1/1/1/3/0/445
MNRTNIAERAICTWKNHFVAIRTGAPSTYRLSNWCKDLEQTDITLNMLCLCTTNPLLSAYEAIEGMFSFDRTPMAPIGTEVMIHIKPNRHQTWGYLAIRACLLDPAITHTDRITKATQHLIRTIDGQSDAPADELRAIQNLRDLITRATQNQSDTVPINEPNPTFHNDAPPSFAPTLSNLVSPDPSPLVAPDHISPQPLHTAPHARVPNHRPTVIPLEEHKYEPATDQEPQYNLRSRPHTVLSAIAMTGEANARGMIVSAVIDNRTGTKTMQYIRKCDIPKNCLKSVAYSKIVVIERPQKKEKEWTCLTVVGTYINYPGNTTIPTSDLTTAKLLFNSVVSTDGATFHGGNLKVFYLNTPMDRLEYMRLKFDLIPQEMITKYKLNDCNEDGWIYMRIDLGMYGLPQEGILANKPSQNAWPKQVTTSANTLHDYGGTYGIPSPSVLL